MIKGTEESIKKIVNINLILIKKRRFLMSNLECTYYKNQISVLRLMTFYKFFVRSLCH